MRSESIVAERKLRRGANLKARAIAIIPRRGRMNLQFNCQIEFCNPKQILFENGGFDCELMLIAGMLIMASAATLEIWAHGLNPMRRSLQNLIGAPPRKATLLLVKCRINFFAFKNEWQKYCLAASLLVGRQTRQSVATINEFFDYEVQDSILCHAGLALHVEQTQPR